MKEHIVALFHRQKSLAMLLATSLCVFIGTFFVIWALLARSYGVERFKQEFVKAVAELNELGFDVAYDALSFSSVSPFRIATFENFKLYKKNTGFSWNVPELTINANILNYGALIAYAGENQSFTLNRQSYPIHSENFSIKSRFDENGLVNFVMRAKKFEAAGLFSVKRFSWAIQRFDDEKKYSSKTDIRHIALLGSNAWHMSDVIDEFFIDFDIIGDFNTAHTYHQSLKDWNNNLGEVDINRLILNWKPLVLVGKGSVSFDENLTPEIKLVTTSRGLVETMENLEKAEIFDGKSVLVAKILLSSKISSAKNPDGNIDALMSSILFAPNMLNIENIQMLKQKDNLAE